MTELDRLRQVWAAFGCAPNPEDFRPEVQAKMWDMVVDLARESATQTGRIYAENNDLKRQLKARLSVQDMTELLARHRMAGQWCEGCKMLVVNAATHHALIIDDEYAKRMIANS